MTARPSGVWNVRRAARVIEESKHEHEAALLIDGDIATIANAMDGVQQARLELLHAAPLPE